MDERRMGEKEERMYSKSSEMIIEELLKNWLSSEVVVKTMERNRKCWEYNSLTSRNSCILFIFWILNPSSVVNKTRSYRVESRLLNDVEKSLVIVTKGNDFGLSWGSRGQWRIVWADWFPNKVEWFQIPFLLLPTIIYSLVCFIYRVRRLKRRNTSHTPNRKAETKKVQVGISPSFFPSNVTERARS